MKNRMRICCLAAGLVLAASPQPARADDADERAQAAKEQQAVIARAQQWQALLDAGSFGEAWDYAASNVRESIAREQFAAGMQKSTAGLGKVVARQVLGVQPIPAAPEAAPTVLVSFQARYERLGRLPAYDYLFLIREDDEWMVAGTFASAGKPLSLQQLLRLADGKWRF